LFCKKAKTDLILLFHIQINNNGGTGHNHIEKTRPQPQQQQPNKKHRKQDQLAQNKPLHFLANSKASLLSNKSFQNPSQLST
jgi:hypothetical protein